MSIEPQQVKALFLAAIEKPTPAERAAFLDEACGDDADVRRRVEELLAANDEPGSFLHKPAAGDTVSVAAGQPSSGEATPANVLRYFGDYELLEEIGRGGMGVVYKARQASLNRVVALKMILTGQLASATDVQRFRYEAEAAANLDHPNIVPIYEVGEHQGQNYFSMKLIDGGNLAETPIHGRHVKSVRERQRRAATLLADVARAVNHAHQHGILHRDLKPANILLDAHGRPQITDFGLAKRLEGGAKLTQSGALVGTPSYMAPEQAGPRDKALTTAVDVYALGAILFELLTGRPPFQAETPLETVVAVLQTEPQRPRAINPALDRDLETICLKCLDKDPGRRYASAEALAEDLERWLRGEPILARRSTTWERAVKWARRRPAVAMLAASLLVIAAASFVVMTVLWLRADTARQSAETERNAKQEALEHVKALRLTASSSAALPSNPTLALLLAVEGASGSPGLMANNALRAALDASHEVRTFAGDLGETLSAEYSSDGKQVLTVDDSGYVRALDADNGTLRWEVPGLYALHPEAHFSPDGRHVAVTYQGLVGLHSGNKIAYTDRVVRIYDAASGKVHAILKGHTIRVVTARFSSDSRRIITASWDRTARVWDVATGEELLALQPHDSSLLTAMFAGDGHRLVTVSSNRKGDVLSYALPPEMKVDPPEIHTDAAISSYGVPILPPGRDTVVARVWDTASGKELKVLSLPGARPGLEKVEHLAAACSPDGRYMLLLSRDFDGPDEYFSGGLLRLFDLGSGKLLGTLLRKKEGDPIAVPSFSPDGRRIVAASGVVAYVWDLSGIKPGQPCDPALVLGGHELPIVSAAFSRQGHIVTASRDRTARVWDGKTGEVVAVLRGHEQPVNTASFGPSGTTVVTAADDGTARLWKAQLATEVQALLKGHTKPVLSIQFSPDSRRVVTASADKTARTWDGATGQELDVLEADVGLRDPAAARWAREKLRGEVHLAQFSPDGDSVLTVSRDLQGGVDGKTVPFTPVRLWDLKTRKERFVLPGQKTSMLFATFSRDGRWIAAVESGKMEERSLKDNSETIRGMGGPPNGGPNVRVWDARTGKEALSLGSHEAALAPAIFSWDSRRLVTSGDFQKGKRQAVEVWDIALRTKVTSIQGARLGLNRSIAQFLAADAEKVLTCDTFDAHLWDVTTGKGQGPLAQSDRQEIGAARVSPNGRWIVFVPADRTPHPPHVPLWDGATGKRHAVLQGHLRQVRSAEFSPDSRFVVTASDDETARVWDVETGQEIHTLTGHTGAVNYAVFSPDGFRVGTASADGTARLWLLDVLKAAKDRKPRELTSEERRRFGIEE